MPGAKSINYIPAILCQAEARSQQAIEAVYVDRDGYLLEGTTSNLVALRGDTLITPPCDRILPGITRQVVLQLARREFAVEERQLHKDEIRLFDEAFLTSSVKEVVPVVAIDSVQVGDGRPGRRTLKNHGVVQGIYHRLSRLIGFLRQGAEDCRSQRLQPGIAGEQDDLALLIERHLQPALFPVHDLGDRSCAKNRMPDPQPFGDITDIEDFAGSPLG